MLDYSKLKHAIQVCGQVDHAIDIASGLQLLELYDERHKELTEQLEARPLAIDTLARLCDEWQSKPVREGSPMLLHAEDKSFTKAQVRSLPPLAADAWLLPLGWRALLR